MEYNLEDVPSYYIGKHKKIEAMDVVLDFQHDNYNLGTALTYIMRAGKKDGNPMSQDITKAIVHLKKELKHQLSLEHNERSNDIPKHIPEGSAIPQGYFRSTTTNTRGEEQGTNRED